MADHEQRLRRRRLFVGWQDPATRSIEPVGALTQVGTAGSEPHYYFSYLRRAAALSFEPFTAFPDLDHLYEADRLFPFFENRTMSRKRPDYARLMEMLDLSLDAEPFEVLARSGGKRQTDRVEVFPEPEQDPATGKGKCMFFARGLRYIADSERVVGDLERGAELRMLQDVRNPKNKRAFLLADTGFRNFGFLPDYLVDHAHEMLSACQADEARIEVEHVNSDDTPRHMRVLCRLTTCWPEDYKPFASAGFAPIVEIPPV